MIEKVPNETKAKYKAQIEIPIDTRTGLIQQCDPHEKSKVSLTRISQAQ